MDDLIPKFGVYQSVMKQLRYELLRVYNYYNVYNYYIITVSQKIINVKKHIVLRYNYMSYIVHSNIDKQLNIKVVIHYTC